MALPEIHRGRGAQSCHGGRTAHSGVVAQGTISLELLFAEHLI